MPHILLHLVVLSFTGCTCAQGPRQDEARVERLAGPHFDEWDRLVRSAALGDADVARIVARDLAGGEVGGSAEIGSALGFLQIAKGEELAEGVAAAAVACGECHSREGVSAPDRPRWTHLGGASWLAAGVVWSDVRAPPADTDVRRAWDAHSEPEPRLSAALQACQACHVDGPAVDPAVIATLCDSPCRGQVELHGAPDGRHVDRLVHQGDLSLCSHTMRTWADTSGAVGARASDKPVSREGAEAFHEQVETFMEGRRRVAVVECPAPDEARMR